MVEKLAMTGRFELADDKHDSGNGKGGRSNGDDGGGGKEVRELLVRAEQAARTILRDNEGDLTRIAQQLFDRETLTSNELYDIIQGGRGELTHTGA
jgi:hypothetical protein